MANNPAPFSRYVLPDPAANRALNDVYDKLGALQLALSRAQNQLAEQQKSIDRLIKKVFP